MKNVFYILILSTMLYSCENSSSKSEKSSKVAEESKANEKLLNEIDNKEKSETNSNSENRLSFSEIRGLLINTPDINDIEKYCGKPDDIYTVGDGKIYLFYNKAQLNGQTGTLLVFYSWTKHYIEMIEFHEPGSRIYLNKVRYMIAPSISN